MKRHTAVEMSAPPKLPFISDSTEEQVFEDCMLDAGLESGPSFLSIDGVTFNEIDGPSEAQMNWGFEYDYPAFTSSSEMVVTSGRHPIDIPSYINGFSGHSIPLTPPDSDPPDSPPGLNTFAVTDTTNMSSVRELPGPRSKRLRPNMHFAVKTEPDDFNMDTTCSPTTPRVSTFVEMEYQCLKWHPFKPHEWQDLHDESQAKIETPMYRVDADKGFNFSSHDDAFVCQKKNHFQVTIHMQIDSKPKFVHTKDGLKQVDKFKLHLYGVKMESPSTKIRIEQSQADRSKKLYEPAPVRICVNEEIKETVGRMHFSETTSNNMRKKGKPNPDQRYFQLVVGIHAHTKSGDFPVCAHSSERIIVRASNPGQFENDMDAIWFRTHAGDSIYRHGSVGINTDRPDEALCVNGNVKIAGSVIHPSDERVKEHIRELDSSKQLHNVSNMKIYQYQYKRAYLEHTGLDGDPSAEGDTGVLAQEIKEILPEAVTVSDHLRLENGTIIDNFLMVDKDRIYMENVGAVKELSKVTDKLENRIEELEVWSLKLQKRRCGTTSSIQSFTRTSSVRSSSRGCLKPPLPDHKASPRVCSHRPHCCRTRPDNRHCCGGPGRDAEVAATVEHGVCTPKFMQILVLLLIAVMMLCIGAMVAVFVKAWDAQSEPGQSGASPQVQRSRDNASTVSPTPSVLTDEATTRSTGANSRQPASHPRETPTTHGPAPPKSLATVGSLASAPAHDGGSTEHATPASTNMSHINKAKCCGRQTAGNEIYGCKKVVTETSIVNRPAVPDWRILESDYRVRCHNCSNISIPFIPEPKLAALTLELNSTSDTQVVLCSTTPPELQQDLDDSNKKKWETCHRWRLPVSQYRASSYHFRVFLKKTENSNLSCDLPSSQPTAEFDDYHINFVRVACDGS